MFRNSKSCLPEIQTTRNGIWLIQGCTFLLRSQETSGQRPHSALATEMRVQKARKEQWDALLNTEGQALPSHYLLTRRGKNVALGWKPGNEGEIFGRLLVVLLNWSFFIEKARTLTFVNIFFKGRWEVWQLSIERIRGAGT